VAGGRRPALSAASRWAPAGTTRGTCRGTKGPSGAPGRCGGLAGQAAGAVESAASRKLPAGAARGRGRERPGLYGTGVGGAARSRGPSVGQPCPQGAARSPMRDGYRIIATGCSRSLRNSAGVVMAARSAWPAIGTDSCTCAKDAIRLSFTRSTRLGPRQQPFSICPSPETGSAGPALWLCPMRLQLAAMSAVPGHGSGRNES